MFTLKKPHNWSYFSFLACFSGMGIFMFVLLIFVTFQAMDDNSTVCEKMLSNVTLPRLQGFVYLDNIGKHVMFFNDKVYECDFIHNDLHPHFIITSAGYKLDRYFEGAHLYNGATIIYAYGLTNVTTKIFIMVTHPDFLKPSLNPAELSRVYDNINGFFYDTSTKTAIEYENSKLPFLFPYVFFSNNVDKVFLHQFHQYSFFPLSAYQSEKDMASFKEMTYLGANQYEFSLLPFKVHLANASSTEERYYELYRNKMQLISAFGFKGKLYFITAKNVYYINEDDFDARLDPNKNVFYRVQKISVFDFFICKNDAYYSNIDYFEIFLRILWIILVLCLICLCFYPLKYFFFKNALDLTTTIKTNVDSTIGKSSRKSSSKRNYIITNNPNNFSQSKYTISSNTLEKKSSNRDIISRSIIGNETSNSSTSSNFTNNVNSLSRIPSLYSPSSKIKSSSKHNSSQTVVELPSIPNPRMASRIPILTNDSKALESNLTFSNSNKQILKVNKLSSR